MTADPGLPFVDRHERPVEAPPEAVWRGVLETMRGGASAGAVAVLLGCEPARAAGIFGEPGSSVPGFAVAEAEPYRLLVLEGRHRFADYRLTFAIDDGVLAATTHARFDGLGRLYRLAVVGTGGHRVATRTLLRRAARTAEDR